MSSPLTIALVTLGDPERLTGGYLYHRRMAAAAPRHGARLEFVSFPDRPFPLAALHLSSVLAAVRRSGARAIALDSIAAAFVGPGLLLARPMLPIVGVLHQPPGGIDHRPVRTAIQAALDRSAYRHAVRLIVASDDLAQQITSTGVPRAKIRVVAPGRDVAPAATSCAADLRHGRAAAALCVGNWIERKGILDLVEAFALVPSQAATLHLAGDDRADPAYARRVRDRIARRDLAGRVVVHGPLPLERVSALYQGADFFVLPSRKEPFGTVYAEAMGAGLAVVGWRAGNLPFLANDGCEGLLVEPGDVAGLAAAISRLALDEPLRRAMGEAARRRALGFPTWEESATRFFEVFHEVVDGIAVPNAGRQPGREV